jgi:hypothetical protein
MALNLRRTANNELKTWRLIMKNLSITILTALISSIVYAGPLEVIPAAVYDSMQVMSSRFGFERVTSDVKITLSGGDLTPSNRPAMILEYIQDGQDNRVELQIFRAEEDSCGSLNFWADYGNNSGGPDFMGGRYNVHFVDHTKRVCEDAPLSLWEAEVRSGYGWCGTMDSVMTLRGNPGS